MQAKNFLLVIGFLSEGALALTWYLGSYFELITPNNKIYSISQFLSLILLILLPLLIFNYLLFIQFPTRKRKEFLQAKVYPLCQIISWPSAITISLLAGIGEELFFRDLLLNFIRSFSPDSLLLTTIAILISSTIFALVHFIGHFKGSKELIFIYTLVGIYFGLIYVVSDSLLICIATHAFYDLIAIITYKQIKIRDQGNANDFTLKPLTETKDF